MQQYQIYQERKPRFKAMQFNGIEDVEALRHMSRAIGFELSVNAEGDATLALSIKGKTDVTLQRDDFLICSEDGTLAVMSAGLFSEIYEPSDRGVTVTPRNGPAGQPAPMAPQAVAPYPPVPTVSTRIPR